MKPMTSIRHFFHQAAQSAETAATTAKAIAIGLLQTPLRNACLQTAEDVRNSAVLGGESWQKAQSDYFDATMRCYEQYSPALPSPLKPPKK